MSDTHPSGAQRTDARSRAASTTSTPPPRPARRHPPPNYPPLQCGCTGSFDLCTRSLNVWYQRACRIHIRNASTTPTPSPRPARLRPPPNYSPLQRGCAGSFNSCTSSFNVWCQRACRTHIPRVHKGRSHAPSPRSARSSSSIVDFWRLFYLRTIVHLVMYESG